MPPMSTAERIAAMGEILGQIQSAGYEYDPNKGFSQWPQVPPPRGTKMNCQAAASLAVKMAEARGVTDLKLVKTKVKDGFFVPAAPGVVALGSRGPMVNTPHVKGWEFDNHYRVKDAKANKVYDPTFGTSGNHNPVGVACTSTEVQQQKQICVYGEKFRIVRAAQFEGQVLSPTPFAPKYRVDDKDYV